MLKFKETPRARLETIHDVHGTTRTRQPQLYALPALAEYAKSIGEQELEETVAVERRTRANFDSHSSITLWWQRVQYRFLPFGRDECGRPLVCMPVYLYLYCTVQTI